MSKLIPLVLSILTVISACQARDASNSAESQQTSSKSRPSSEVIAPTSSDIGAGLANLRRMAEIDRRYPAPEVPSREPHAMLVLSVDDNGVLSLNDGTKVRIDGVTCNRGGIAELRSLLLSTDTTVAFMDTPATNDQPTPVNLWLISHVDIDGRRDPSYVRIAEAAIASGWCTPRKTPTSKYDARYEAIAGASGK